MAKEHQTESNTFPGILAILFLVPILFYESVESMVDIWVTNETFTHGFLIFPICLYLIWLKKDDINLYPAKPEPRILLLLTPALGIWLISNIVDVQVIQQLLVISLIPIIVWLLYGRKILQILLFPLLYLYFSVPIGQGLIPAMMEFTANFTVSLIQLTGIPLYRDGLSFSLPSGSWSVVEECSGVRYIIASLALGTIYAYINYSATSKRLIFILFAILVPILANGVRAFGIVMIGHFSGMELATGADHLLYGWVFFGIVIFLMFYIGSFFWDAIVIREETSSKAIDIEPDKSASWPIITLSILTIISIVSVELFANNIKQSNELADVNINLSVPDHFDEWQFDKTLSLNWNPEINNPDAYLSRNYRYGRDLVQLDIGYFKFQRKNAEAISSRNRLTNPYSGQWKITHTTDLKEGSIYVTETVLQDRQQKILVWNWYQVGMQQTPNAYIAKAFEAYNHLVFRRNDVAIISIATIFEDDKGQARSKLRDFWSIASENISTIIAKLPSH